MLICHECTRMKACYWFTFTFFSKFQSLEIYHWMIHCYIRKHTNEPESNSIRILKVYNQCKVWISCNNLDNIQMDPRIKNTLDHCYSKGYPIPIPYDGENLLLFLIEYIKSQHHPLPSVILIMDLSTISRF